MSLQQLQGFALALSAMVLYGVYMAPRKKSKASNDAFSLWMGVGILIGTTIIVLLDNGLPQVNTLQYFIMAITGIVWGTGTIGYCRAVQLIGMSRSTPVKNLSAMFGTLLGVAVFHEFSLCNPVSFILVFCGSAAVVLSTNVLGRVEAPSANGKKIGRRTLLAGFLWAFWAAVAYSLYTVPLKIMYSQGIGPSEFLFIMGQGVFVGMAAPFVFARIRGDSASVQWRDRRLAISSGLMWAVGSLAANIAVKSIGVAVTWPLTKTTLVAVLYGVIVFKEVDVKRHKADLVLGILLSILGVTLLGFAMLDR